MNDSTRRYKFKMADLKAIIDDMNGADWIQLFERISVDHCVRLCYNEI
jgi:hypothetical protein